MKTAITTDGHTVRDPTHCDDEILPSSWQEFAEALGIPEEQIFRSWRRFKDLSRFPWERRRWLAWIAKEKVRRSA